MNFWLSSEDLPRPENRIYYDGDRVVLDVTEQGQEAHQRLRKKLEHYMSRNGASPVLLERNLYLGKGIPISGTAHQAGTARFGADPANSVLDLNCKAHELDNLYVIDASFFPSIGAVNPTLTIIANALRVAGHIQAEARRMTAAALATLAVRYLLVMLFFPFSAADKIFNFKGAVAQARQIAPTQLRRRADHGGPRDGNPDAAGDPDRHRGPRRRLRAGGLLHGDGVAVEAVLEAGRFLACRRQQGLATFSGIFSRISRLPEVF